MTVVLPTLRPDHRPALAAAIAAVPARRILVLEATGLATSRLLEPRG